MDSKVGSHKIRGQFLVVMVGYCFAFGNLLIAQLGFLIMLPGGVEHRLAALLRIYGKSGKQFFEIAVVA